ncbi:MAG: gliding motility-associated C-terminal domain-containing protein [Bacteroidales bacterium]
MKLPAIIYAIPIILTSTGMPAQPVHYLHCLAVNENTMELTWENQGNAGNFISCEIYHASPPLPLNFTRIAEITGFTTNTHIHSNIDPQKNHYYYLKTITTNLPPIYSDTLKSINLSVTDPGNGDIVLSWNPMHSPVLPSWNTGYEIFMEYPEGTWTSLGTTVAEQYVHEVTTCGDSLTFRVELPDNIGCTSVSGLAGGTYDNIRQPPMPVMDSVSVISSTEHVVIGWEPSPATDVEAYVIYRFTNGNWIKLDTVWGRFNTIYEDPSAQPCTQSESYAMAALDSCGNPSLGTYLHPQQTIRIDPPAYDPCQLTHLITWSSYINMNPQLEGYRIYVRRDNGPFTLAGTTSTGTQSFLYDIPEPGSRYDYYIRAFNLENENSSTSCITGGYVSAYAKPAFHYLANASVIQDSYIRLELFPDTSATINEIMIHRYNDNSGFMEVIATLETDHEDGMTFEDRDTDPLNRSYRYVYTFRDSCGAGSAYSNELNTMHLRADMINGNQVQLLWDPFTGWDGGTSTYEVFRINRDQGTSTSIATVEAGTTEYTDDLTHTGNTGNTFAYLVAAHEGPGNAYGLQRSSYSNEAMIKEKPEIFMPNAFRPDGINSVFKPVGRFVNLSGYTLRIYNRWGVLVFESNAFDKGWNGDYNGERSPAGAYIYVISGQSPDGSFYEDKGSFILLR